MDMKMKIIESPEDGLRTLSPATLKYLQWIISKLCALIESAPSGALVWYKLQFEGEGREGAPSTQVESEWMRKLELWNCFEFTPSFQDIGQAMIVDRQHGEEIIEMLTKGLKEDTDPERKFKQGWLSNYKIDSLKKYLNEVESLQAIQKQTIVDESLQQVIYGGYIPQGWKWFDKEGGIYQFGNRGNFTQPGKKARKKVFLALMDTFEKSPQAISVATLNEVTGIKSERIRIEIDAINGRLTKEIGFYFRGSGKGYYTLEKTYIY